MEFSSLSKNKKRVELLSPAGDMESLKAALYAGADAVYLGGERYSARAFAKNFSEEELISALKLAHLLGRKVYLTLNTLLKDKEIEGVTDYVYPLYINGLDGIIVQDTGVIRVIRDAFPKLDIHASTQMSITDTEGIGLMKELSVTRVVPARELSLPELKRIHEETGMELECFIHGALCYSYSGKCLFSSLAGGRSGNRGRCAQSCRLPYNGRYYLSAKDICALGVIDKLIEAGVYSFKIEGRMKSPEYVAGVTGIYRKYIDLILSGEKMPEYRADRERLIGLYTRGGSTEGYYFKRNGKDMITPLSPSYESADEDEKKRMFQEYAGKSPVLSADALICIEEGKKAELSIRYMNGEDEIKTSVFSDLEAGKAEKRPLSLEDVRKQMTRTGNTLFQFKNLDIVIKGEPFMPVSSLNELRRKGLAALENRILSGYERGDGDFINIRLRTEKDLMDTGTESAQGAKGKGSRLNVSLESLKGLKESLKYGEVCAVTLPLLSFEDEEELQKTSERVREAGKKLYLGFPFIVRDGLLKDKREDIISLLKYADGVYSDNYESLYFLKDIGYEGTVTAGLHIYGMNREAVHTLKEIFPGMITTVPVELNKKELLQRGIRGEELIVYGYLPMMLSAQCLYKNMTGEKSGGKKTAGKGSEGKDKWRGSLCAGRKREVLRFKDRLSNEFFCINYCSECTNVIYNHVPLLITGDDRIIERLSPKSLRLSFTGERPEEIDDIINYYVNSTKDSRIDPPDCLKEHTKGHLNRGVE